MLRWLIAGALLLTLELSPAKGGPEIWIAQRTDGKKGRGTMQDPFDGSTQARFDRILRGHWWRGTENLTVHILSGVYETYGNGDYVPGLTNGLYGWRCNSGWTISGAGQKATTLKLIKVFPAPDGKTFSILGIATANSDVTNVTIEDLTIDCNHQGIGNKQSTEAGVGLQGSGHTIRRVKVKNASGWGLEGFPIGLGAVSVNSSNNLIENCTITGWQGGAGGSIGVANNMNNMKKPLTYTSAVVRNCRVEGVHIAYGGWGMKNVTFSGNVAVNCDYGVNIDSAKNQNVTFSNNELKGCKSYGMVFANCSKFKIADNTITLAKGGTFLFFTENDGYFLVTGNTFRAADPHSNVAVGRETDSLFGKFIFSKNTTNTAGSIQLPAKLVQKN